MKNLKPPFAYGLFFICGFNVFFGDVFDDSLQTRAMFTLISFILAFIVILFFVFYRYILKRNGFTNYILIDAIALYLLSELAIIVLLREPSFFGVFAIPDGKEELIRNRLIFQKNRDVAFSTSFIIASGLYFLTALLFKQKAVPAKEISDSLE